MNRDALIARAKRIATPVASCVAASLSPAHLIGDASREELLALVIVLAEAADPARLRAVAEATEDSPGVTAEDVRLREAHRQAWHLRKAGLPVPARLRVLDNRYRERRRELRAAAGEARAA